MRVVAGTLRGRTIAAPSGRLTRPTTDRTREAMFNSLASLGVVDGAAVADLFAGSGALGIEALSRGAASCTFVETDASALAAIRENVRRLGLSDRSDVVVARVESAMRMLHDLDLVLVDPPYDFEEWGALMEGLEKAVTREAVIVVESGRDVEGRLTESGRWGVVRAKRYGRTWVTFLRQI